jgi:hypothetical protein
VSPLQIKNPKQKILAGSVVWRDLILALKDKPFKAYCLRDAPTV